MSWKTAAIAGLVATLAGAGAAHASALYFQGFETDTSGWIVSTGGDNNGAITRTTSGGGALGLTAFDGSHYAEVKSDTNGYQPGYGSGGFNFLNGNGSTPTAYPGNFSQSISIYINTATAAPTNPATPAFWIDMSPTALAPDGVGCDPFACSDEHNFQLSYTGSTVKIGTNGGAASLTLTNSGWYTFQITYKKGTTPASLVDNDLNVFDASGTLLSTSSAVGNSDGGTLTSANLGGPGYIWLSVWQNGFAGDLLGIDDVRADTLPVPEPSSIALLLTGILGLGLAGRLRTRRTPVA